MLVVSKMRLASKGLSAKKRTKEITFPCLELLIMIIGVRTANIVINGYKVLSLI